MAKRKLSTFERLQRGERSNDYGKSTGDVFFALSRDEPGTVTFTPVTGRVQVGGDFAFER